MVQSGLLASKCGGSFQTKGETRTSASASYTPSPAKLFTVDFVTWAQRSRNCRVYVFLRGKAKGEFKH